MLQLLFAVCVNCWKYKGVVKRHHGTWLPTQCVQFVHPFGLKGLRFPLWYNWAGFVQRPFWRKGLLHRCSQVCEVFGDHFVKKSDMLWTLRVSNGNNICGLNIQISIPCGAYCGKSESLHIQRYQDRIPAVWNSRVSLGLHPLQYLPHAWRSNTHQNLCLQVYITYVHQAILWIWATTSNQS